MRTAEAQPAPRLSLQTVPPGRPVPDLAEDVRDGLREPPYSLPPKYFYDDRGSRLFDIICDTPEYYPTRTEDALLGKCAAQVLEAVRPAHILELGSGAARKTRHLLQASERLGMAPCYWPFDVCAEIVEDSAGELLEDYPWLEVRGLVGDYLAGLEHLQGPDGPTLYAFLGGTIGNFTEAEAIAFLSELRGRMGPDDALLIGADRAKDHAVLHAAYNDAGGVTAEFNLNLLRVLNRELGADFDPRGFRHEARFNAEASQIEMYLVATRDQVVDIPALGQELRFAAGERILTEISRKFTPSGLQGLLAAAGLAPHTHFEPDNGYFSLALAVPG